MAPTNSSTEKPSGAPDCLSARCGVDAGCRKEPDNSWICICTHDLSPPRADGSCPRIVVKGSHHPVANKNTLISVHSRKFNNRTDSKMADRHLSTLQSLPALDNQLETSFSATPSTTVTWLISVVAVVIFLAALCWLRRRWRNKKKSVRSSSSSSSVRMAEPREDEDSMKPTTTTTTGNMPVCLSKNVLHQERLTNNPEYDWNGEEYGGSSGSDTTQLLNAADQFKPFVIIRPEMIQLKQEIGEGCFGKVFRGSLRRQQHPDDVDQGQEEQLVAVKVLKAQAGPTAQDDLLQEAEIMASFTHPNILSLKGIVINEPTIGPWLVFEYMALGDLAQLLRAANGNLFGKTKNPYALNRDDLHSIAEQIADGMAYLSSQHFVHRDLACRNCLVGERPQGGGLSVKISDFGMSRDVYTCDYYKIGGSRMLPVRWMAPESILYGKFTLESDVWSFGVVLWEVFALGVQPYYGHSNEQVVKLILQGILLTPPQLAPPLIVQLLNGCWKTQPSDRLTFAEINSKLKKRRQHSVEASSSVTYVHLRHNEVEDAHRLVTDEYLQTLPDLPVHQYSNT